MRPKIQQSETYRADGAPRSRLGRGDVGLRRDACQCNDPHVLALAFVIQEEECFVLHNGAAKRTAELIVVKRRLGMVEGIEEIPRVQGIVAQILEGAAVQLVRSAPGHDVDDRAAVSSVLGLEIREYAHFA